MASLTGLIAGAVSAILFLATPAASGRVLHRRGGADVSDARAWSAEGEVAIRATALEPPVRLAPRPGSA